ncbi:hypothetical protein Dimus_039603 [Dionaea muscipula]
MSLDRFGMILDQNHVSAEFWDLQILCGGRPRGRPRGRPPDVRRVKTGKNNGTELLEDVPEDVLLYPFCVVQFSRFVICVGFLPVEPGLILDPCLRSLEI